jgi:vancomycin permeability regulator SanA
MYDAIIVLGGSYIDANTLPEWVENRLDAAILRNYQCNYIMLMSRGTPHKPPPLDEIGHPIDECQIMANYILKNSLVPTSKLLLDSWSMDTIGNAYAALTMHAIPRNLRKILIITSDFHMPRTQAIFSKVFSLFPLDIFDITYLDTPSVLPISDKEQASLVTWRETSANIHTLVDLHDFIFTKHKAYTPKNHHHENDDNNEKYSESDMKAYCT